MAKELAQFAGGGAVVHDNRFDPELSEDIIQYLKTESDFRQFIRNVPTDSYVINLPRKWAAGRAVEVVEGSEIPKARDVYDVITINLRQNGTGIKMTDEEQDMMGFDPNYFQTEAKRAAERLLKKENDDISACLLAGAGYIVTSAKQVLDFNTIVDAKTKMIEQPYSVNPNIIIMSPRSYADLVKDQDFKLYQNSGKTNVVNSGDIGMQVDGMDVKIIPEVGDNVYLIDTDKQPIVLVTKGQVKTESYRLPETREDVLDLTVYEKPAVLRPDAIMKVEITRANKDSALVYPDGWDPIDKKQPTTP